MLAVALVYGRTAAFDFTYLDDQDLIVGDAPFLASPWSFARAFGRPYFRVIDPEHVYYRPLVTASYALDARWSGVRPFGYHITNVALMAIAAGLLLVLLRRLDVGRGVALAGALVFAVHPALVSAVAWVPGRNDTLLAVFALAGWLFFLRSTTFDRALALVFLAFALFTKESASVLPFVWALSAALVAPDVWASLRTVRGASSFGIGCAAVVAAYTWARGRAMTGEATLAVASNVVHNLPAVITSFGKLAFPVHLSVLAVPEDTPLWPGIAAALAFAFAVRLVPRVRLRVVAFGASAFAAFLAPALAAHEGLLLENRLVLPAVGVLVIAAELVRALSVERRLFGALSGTMLVGLATVACAYTGSFRDRRAFGEAAVAGSPHSALAHFCLGETYQIAKMNDRALAEYTTSLALEPSDVVHNNIAVIHMAEARWPQAEHELYAELALNPRYAKAYYNLGIVLRHEQRFDEAIAAEETALALDPGNADAAREVNVSRRLRTPRPYRRRRQRRRRRAV